MPVMASVTVSSFAGAGRAIPAGTMSPATTSPKPHKKTLLFINHLRRELYHPQLRRNYRPRATTPAGRHTERSSSLWAFPLFKNLQ